MADRIDIAGSDPLTDLKERADCQVPACGESFGDHHRHLFGMECRGSLRRVSFRPSSPDLIPCNQAAVDQQLDQAREPFFVVTAPEILGRGNQLALIPHVLDGPLAPGACREIKPKDSALPASMED